MKLPKEAKNKFLASLSYEGDSWLRDPEFVVWWKEHSEKFPNISEIDARNIWTAGYDDGYWYSQEPCAYSDDY